MSVTMTASEAAALVAADQQKRAQACGEAVAAVLREHGCDLVAVPQIVEGRIVAVVKVVAK